MRIEKDKTAHGYLDGEWEDHGDTVATGYAFVDNEGYSSAEIAALLDSASNLEAVLPRLNGFFAAIIERDGEIHLISDRVASHALFYGESDGDIYFSDDATWVRNQVGDSSYDSVSELEYLLSGYVTGSNTLSPNVRQVLSGEHFRLSETGEISRQRWFEFPSEEVTTTTSDAELLNELDRVLKNAYKRLVAYANGRPIIVSLSAGHDSRLSLLMLLRLGYDNVIAFSYAEKDAETELVKRIVDDLGVPWIYVAETHEQWYNWYNSPEREHYEDSSGYLDRIPAIGSVLGVKAAKEHQFIPNNSVFITGDGVVSTGEHIPPAFMDRTEINTRDVLTFSSRSHYKFWDYSDEVEEILINRMYASGGQPEINNPDDAVRFSQHWDWQERQSKFIPRNHVFEFFGFDWWMPLWDANYVKFWDRLPTEKKFNKQIHRNYVEKLHQEVAGISRKRLEKATWSGATPGQKFKNTLRHTKLDPTGTRFDKLARKVYYRYVDPMEYAEYPIFGIMKREQYKNLQTGLLEIHAFQALEILDRVSFNPPETQGVPGSIAEVLE